MKKILSSLLAFAMVLALFSGVIVFNASADDTQEFHIPFINQYTLAQAQQMAKGTNGTVSFDKTGDGKTVIIGTTGANASYGNYYFQFDTAKGIDQWSKNKLIDGIKIFKGADFSNKSAIAVKFADVDGYDATASIADAKGMFLTLGSSTKAVAIDFKNPTKQNGYFYFDFTGAQFVGAGWYQDCPTFKDAFFHTIDQTKVQINMNVGEAKLAFVVEDMYLVGRNDTEKLGELIVEAEAEGIDCTAERALYFSDTATQDDVDAAAAALNAVLHPYEYYDLVGFTKVAQAELDTLSGNVGYANGAIYNAVTSKLELTENPGEIKLSTNPANNQAYTQSIVTYKYNSGATLNDSPWTPVDASKKLGDMDGIRFKLTDADGKPVSFYGQYRFIVQASGWGNYWYYRGKPSIDEDGYNFIDFGRIYRASTTNTEQLLSNELNKLDGISFLMYGAPQTIYFSDFQGYVRNVKRSEGLEFVDLPGFNDWTQDNLDLTNAAALADSGAVGTAMQFYDKAGVMRGNSTHGLLPTKDYKPNNWTQMWGTQTSTDTAAEQQNGDVFGAYKAIGELQKYDGIRIGISTTATGGGDPATYSWDGHKRVNISFKLIGSGQKSFNNSWYPTFSCDYSCASGELFPNYEDGYLYFYFDDMKSGWADQVLSQYANTTQLYGNFQMSYVGGGCNSEWRRLVVSDMQLFRDALADPTEGLWAPNYTEESWAALEAAVEARDVPAIAEAKANLKPAVIDLTTENMMQGWTTENVNAPVTLNADRLCDSIGDGLNAPNVWNGGDFSNNTVFEASNNFSMTATADFTGKSMGWKNLDRTTMNTASAGAYPILNTVGIENGAGIRFKLDVEGGSFERLLIGLSNCGSGGNKEMYVTKILPDYFDEEGYINLPFSAFEKAWWGTAFTEENIADVKVLIVEAYGVTDGTKLTISDLTGYKPFDPADYVGDLWEYNYTSDSWAAVQAAAEAGDKDALIAAKAALEPLFVKPVTGNFFEGWTTTDVNKTVTANSGKLCDSIGDGLNAPNVWNNGDFSNNTSFEANNNFSMMATADFTGKSMGWKNMDRSKTLQTADNGAYPALNVAGLSKADGIRFKIEVEDGTAERLLIGLSNCSKFVREMYATQIKPEYVAEDGYINIPFSVFEKAWWCDAFAQNELEDVIVFIVEAYNVSKFTTIRISDMYGYVGRDFDIDDESLTNLWQYNYTADSWTAYEDAIAAARTVEERDAALAKLVPYETIATTDDFFTGWTTEAVNAVVTANSDKLCDSIGEGLNINNAWNAGDFSNNTTFAIDADGAFVMTATGDFTGKAMGWKNMDRSQTLQPDNNGAYPALTVAGLSKAEGIRLKIEANKPIERILIGLSNCSKFVREMYAMKIKPEFVAEDGYINIPFSYFEKAFWCSAFAQDELEDVIVFIVEAYGAENGTELKLADVKGYTTIVPPSAAEITALETVIATLTADDIDTRFTAEIAAAEATKTSEDHDDVLDATAAIQAIVDELESDGRPALKEAIGKVDKTKYPDEVAAGIAAYYDETATADDVAAATKALQRIIDQPAAPTVTYEVTDSSITVTAVEGAEYKLGTGEWQDSNVFENLGANVEYQVSVRIKATDDFIASEATVVNVTTNKTSFGEATVTVSGTEKYDETLTATVADVPELIGTNYTIEWHNADGEKIGTGETYVLAADEIGTTVYAELVSDVASDTVKSDATGTIGKGVIKNYTLPTAAEITYPQTLADSVLSGGDTGTVTGTWAWATPDEIPLISQSGSLFAITFTPDAAYADLYEGIEAEIALTVNAPSYTAQTFTDINGLKVEGEFMDAAGLEMHVEPIAYSEPAYQSLLRASSKDASGLKKLVLFKRVYFTFNGEVLPDLYAGGLTVSSVVGADRAGQQYSTWFFVVDKPANYRGTVDATGTLVVENVLL